MKCIVFVGVVGVGKIMFFNVLWGNYFFVRKMQVVEFNDYGDIDMLGEYFSYFCWYYVLIIMLQDVDMLIYVYVVNDKESCLFVGLLDVGICK